MSLTYEQSTAVSLFGALVTEWVSASEIEVGDVVRVDDWSVIRVAEVRKGAVSQSLRVYPLWRDAQHEITFIDESGAGPRSWSDNSRVERIPRHLLRTTKEGA